MRFPEAKEKLIAEMERLREEIDKAEQTVIKINSKHKSLGLLAEGQIVIQMLLTAEDIAEGCDNMDYGRE